MQYKPSKWVSGYKHGPAASYTQITRMGLFLNVATSKFEPLDSTWDNLHSGGMFISDDNKIYFRDETNKDIYINSPADNQLALYASSGVGVNVTPTTALEVSGTWVSGKGMIRGVSDSHAYLTLDSATDADAGIRLQEGGSATDKWVLFNDGDASDILRLINAAGAGVRNVTKAGEITAPLQPAFLAHPASQQDNIATSSSVEVVWGTERFDQGGDFASNTFTAPVTGKYQLNCILYMLNMDTAAGYYQFRWVTSNKTYYAPIVDPGGLASDPVYWSISGSILVDMDASDTVTTQIFQDGGTQQTDISNHSFFSGHLAC